MLHRLRTNQRAYLAGFLDGDGSIYVRMKPNSDYRFGYQIAPFVVFFQAKTEKFMKSPKKKPFLLEKDFLFLF